MSLHEYGKIEDGIFRYQGVNSRMDEIQAAVLNVKLQYPENEQKARYRQVQLYLEHLDDSIKDRCIAAKLILLLMKMFSTSSLSLPRSETN